jgi:protein O-GlcNAc transferase
MRANTISRFFLFAIASLGAAAFAAPIVSFPTAEPSSTSSLINDAARKKLLDGTASASKGEFTVARQAYTDATRLDTKSAGPFLALAELELAQGNISAADLAFQDALKRTQHWSVEHMRAKIQVAKNDLLGAEISLKDAAAKHPNEATLPLVLGDLYLNRLQQLPEAKAAYERAIAIRPGMASAHYALGVTLQQQGKTVEARAAYEKSKTLAPDIALPALALARLDINAQRYDAAIAELTAVTKSHPQLAQARLELGDAHFAKNDDKLALENYSAYSKAQPKNAIGFQKIAVVHHRAGQTTEAIAAYRKAIAADKDAAVSLNNLAYLLAQTKTDLPEAEKHAKRAAELDPRAGAVAATLGWVYRAQGKLPEAEAQIRKAITLTSPEIAEQQAMLAAVLAEQNKTDDAKRSAQRAQAIDANNKLAADMLKKLK